MRDVSGWIVLLVLSAAAPGVSDPAHRPPPPDFTGYGHDCSRPVMGGCDCPDPKVSRPDQRRKVFVCVDCPKGTVKRGNQCRKETVVVKPAPSLRWAVAGTGNMKPMGVEANGVSTYTCRARVSSEFWLGRTWPGAGCFIGIDGRSEYAKPNDFDVLVGDGGTLQNHTGGVVSHAAKLDDRLVICVALRPGGGAYPGWLAPRGRLPRECVYQFDGHDAHESTYQLLIVDETFPRVP